METRMPSAEYEAIGRDLMACEPSLARIAEHGVEVAFLASDAAKRKGPRDVLGECEKVPAKWRWAVPYDFTVTVFEPNCERLTDEQLRILLLHELLHVGIEEDGNDAKLYVEPHDVEDFNEVIDRYGLDWANG